MTAINARLSSQGRDRLRLDPTAGYSWVRRGFRPRLPIPGIAAAVLTERLGYTVTVAELWPGRPEPSGLACTATGDLDGMTGVDDLIRELSQLGVTAATPQSPIAEASGADLTAVVLDQLNGAVVLARDRAGHDHVLPEQVDLISSHVAALRRLDDRHGGGALSLRYVTAELRSVADLVQYASYDRGTGTRLLTIVADLAQLLGWLSFDSSRYGAAERYLLLSLGVCRALGARDRAANAIGMLSYVSAFAGHGRQAIRLAEAATSECGRGDPVLRARLLGRDATAAAADGDLARFRRQSQEAAALLERHAARGMPPFLYYLTPDQLSAEAGWRWSCWPSRPPPTAPGCCPKQFRRSAARCPHSPRRDQRAARPPTRGRRCCTPPSSPRLICSRVTLRRPSQPRGSGWACARKYSRREPGAICARCGQRWPGAPAPRSCATCSTNSIRHHRLCDDHPR